MNRIDVDGMLADMTGPQLAGWLAYYQAEPWGEERADLRSAMIVAKLHNLFRGKHSPSATTRDFMPQFGRQVRQTPRQMFEVIKIAAAFAGFGVEPENRKK